MTRDEAVAEVQEGLGFRSDLSDAIVRRMKRVQFLLEQGSSLPWFLLTESAPLAVVAGDDPAIPDDFLREVEYDHGLYYQEDADSGVTFIQKIGYDEGLLQYADADDGDFPKAYAVRKTTFRIFPRTTGNITLYWDYYAADELLDGGTVENGWLTHAPYLLIGNAGASIAATLRNPGAVQEFTQLAQTAFEKLHKQNILRETTNRKFILGRNT